MMTATVCPPLEQLKAMTLGQLSDEQSQELVEHLQNCQSCRSELDTIEDSEDSLIASLRTADQLVEYDAEPDCGVAVARALGALALIGESPTQTENAHVLPKQIGEYEIVRPLGSGGMGSVYLARHLKLARDEGA